MSACFIPILIYINYLAWPTPPLGGGDRLNDLGQDFGLKQFRAASIVLQKTKAQI